MYVWLSFYKEPKVIQGRKEQSFNKWWWNNWVPYGEKNFDLYLTLYKKN